MKKNEDWYCSKCNTEIEKVEDCIDVKFLGPQENSGVFWCHTCGALQVDEKRVEPKRETNTFSFGACSPAPSANRNIYIPAIVENWLINNR